MIIKIPANGKIYEEQINPKHFNIELFEASTLMKNRCNAKQEGILRKNHLSHLHSFKNKSVEDMLEDEFLGNKIAFYTDQLTNMSS